MTATITPRADPASPTSGPDGSRLRIAFVVHDYHRHGGHARYVAELAARFKREHDVTVFANRFEEPEPAGITYRHVPAWRANALTTIVSFMLPATVLVRGRFDIIHAQGLCGLRQNVVTAHICLPAWNAAGDRYAGRPGWRKRVFRAVVTRLERLALRPGAAARFIAPSARAAEDLAAYFGLHDSVRVIRHGVDTELFHPRNRPVWRGPIREELGLATDDCVALYVGDPQKALPAAIRALAKSPGVRLVAVSKSDPMPYATLATSEGVAARVRFVAGTEHVERYYAAADLFLFPTYYDTFGLVLTEAMASGLPVVTSRAAGAAELVTHGESGWLTDEPWDVESIAARIRALSADGALRGKIGAAARAAVEQLAWDRVAEQTMAVYREVLAGG
jgi:UDP-glucose:(heptosyl)LPS alpha-1,3-glucosyltransferase